MKTKTFATLCASGLALAAAAQTAPIQTTEGSDAGTNGPTIGASLTAPAALTPFVPPGQASGGNGMNLRLNFQNAPLSEVLKYLSDAAGFTIILDTTVHGNVSVISTHPMNRGEAVDLLNSVLSQNGYAAVRNGQTLTIMDKSAAKTRNIPVITGNNPALIPDNDEIVTQIIPVRYVQARQLVTDLASFVSAQATIVANDAGNTIVVTDTESNIRHLVEIIEAVDNSAQGETEIRVFPLKYANPNDVATELGQIFPNNGASGSQTPVRFGGGGPGGFFRRMMAAASQNNQSAAMQKQSQVIAVADGRTQSVIVMASKDLMDQISGMVEQLDLPSSRDQKVYVYHMSNGDPQQALQVLQNMFQTSNSRNGAGSASAQNSALQTRANQNAATIGNSSTSSGTPGVGGATMRPTTGTGQMF
ncbi:MAG: hypothetical protein KGR98_06040 [Verrucomicrobia bacterium]|nr:hypothetical protein [Verrucomicrobiota bacterium]MDE3099537.1 hypothetical protein [Verrucomicrobiota bacterium]